MRAAAKVAIPVLFPRAVLLWGLTRLLFAALPLAIGEPFGSIPPPAVGIVAIAGFVGLVDVRVRGERALWANLGTSPRLLYLIYSAAAIPCELVLAGALGLR